MLPLHSILDLIINVPDVNYYLFFTCSLLCFFNLFYCKIVNFFHCEEAEVKLLLINVLIQYIVSTVCVVSIVLVCKFLSLQPDIRMSKILECCGLERKT